MASGDNFSVGNGNPFAGGGNPLAGGGGNSFVGGGGNPLAGGGSNSFASAGGNPFASASGNPFAGAGGNSFAGGGEAKTFNFNGSWNWDFGTNNPTVSQDNGFMGGNSKPEAVPESTSSIAIAIAGITCLLWSRLKKVKHS